MAEDMDFEQSHDIITLTLDDDTELECVVLNIFTVEDKEYIALISVEELAQDDHDGEVLIYQFKQTDDEEPELINIETDEEFDLVSEAFSQLMDELEAEDESDMEDFTAGE